MNHIRVHSIPGTLHFYQPRQFYPVHLLQQLTYIQKFISSFTKKTPSGTASSPDLFPNAPIIILDEATAYTDAENEELITNALNELTKGRTVIMIAHRLGTIADADNIVVLDSGRVSANGTHDELMENSSIYRRLWQMSLEAGSWNIAVKEGAENV